MRNRVGGGLQKIQGDSKLEPPTSGVVLEVLDPMVFRYMKQTKQHPLGVPNIIF